MPTAATPKPMNISPAAKSFGWRILAMAPSSSGGTCLFYARAGQPAAASIPVLGAQILQVRVDHLRLHALRELRLDLVEARDLRVANVIDFDHVPAELRLHRRRRELAFRQSDHRIGERLHEVRRRIPVEI